MPENAVTAFGPDFPFDYAAWLNHPSGPLSIPAEMRGTEVAVVGAGISGVVAAYELLRLGLRPVVYEAGRMGGRLRSEPFGADPEAVAELGGMRFPMSGTAFYHYLDGLGLDTKPFPNPLTPAAPTTVVDLAGQSHFARSLDDLPPLFHEVADAWSQALEDRIGFADVQTAIASKDPAAVAERWHPIVAAWDDRTFYDFVATSPSFSKLTYRHREVFGQVGFGTGGWDSDFPNSMLEILRVVLCDFEERQRFVVGGVEQLPRGLWAAAPEQIDYWEPGTSLASLHGGAPEPGVTAIRRNGDEIVITDRWGMQRSFPAVLVTAQSWLMTTSIDVEESLFSQKLWMALDRTRYMQSSKTFVMVDRPFWHDIDPATGQNALSMTLTDRNTRGTYLFDNGPDRPAVICLSYAWMSDALKVLPMPPEERAELALETLEKIYPTTKIRQHIIGQPITVSWEADPLFLGAFKGALPGHYRYNRRMYGHFMQEAMPAHERGLFLAGDDVSWTPGWAEGAVQTALNATWGIVHHLGGGSPADNPGPGDVWAERAPVLLPDD